MGSREYWNIKDGHYLGPAHDAVPLRVDPANPLDYGKPGVPVGPTSSGSASTSSASSTALGATSIPTTRR